ncbi:MAG: glycosyltransferase family 2 protein [Microgenomates group bacterium]
MAKPLISVCIPNFNRADFLAKNLAAIGRQADRTIEVVISDNASTEDTRGVVGKFQNKFPNLKVRFHRNRTNVGFDKNVIRVVDLARGEYCWLLSNDDQILPGSLAKIKQVIHTKQPAFIFVNYSRFDNRVKKVTAARMVDLKRDLHFGNASEFYFWPTPSSYFKLLGINVLTMSCDIFKRKYWRQSITKTQRFVDHNFIHVFTILDFIRYHPQIYVMAKPQVQYVSNNHRPWANYIWTDYRHHLLDSLLRLGYDSTKVKKLKEALKQDEINERLLIKGEKLGIYQKLYPIIRKIRNLLGHRV